MLRPKVEAIRETRAVAVGVPALASRKKKSRSLGLAAHLGWARLLVDRYRDLAEIPAPTREGPGSGRRHFAPDDEGAFEYENYHNPDHTY